MSRRLLGLSWALVGVVLVATAVRPLPAQDVKKQPALLKVLMPDKDATLTIDDTPTKQTGKTRTFQTPPFEVGKKYSYTLTADWKPNNYTDITRVRDVIIEPGKETVADLTGEPDRKTDTIKVRYVPTPQPVVEEMLKLGGAKKDDVVYDLGCGDGRIVCTAVAKFGAKKGVGVDIDPERIKDCERTAKEFKVEKQVEFRKEDVLKLKDISDASLVMLYMGEDLNKALRPILQSQLKPGSRVVSHRFLMGKEWEPDKTITFTNEGEEYKLHLWVIPDPKK